MHIIRSNPFWSEDNVMNMLLRYDNWNNATHTPLNLSYKVNVPHIGQPLETYSDLEALMHIMSDTFGIEIRSTGPLGEYDIETKQGTFLTSDDWKYYDIIKKIKDTSAYDTPRSSIKLAELGITKDQINSAFEEVEFASDINIEKFSFMYERIEAVKNSKSINQYQSAFKSSQEFDESLEVAKYTTSNLFELWARYTDINIQPTNNNEEIKIDVRLLKSEDENNYFTVYSGPQYEYTEWDNGKTTSFKGELSLSIRGPEFSVIPISMSDFPADAFIELHHGIAHAFLDHPVDSLLFNGGRKNFKYDGWEDIVISSLTYNPFSLCMSVLGDIPCMKNPHLVRSIDSSLIKENREDYIEADDGENIIYLKGKELHPITPMPLDIKAMQYLYTPNCKNSGQEITYKFDGNGSESIFGFKIPPQAIFTLWDCSKKKHNRCLKR
ncbi:hypothetical protein I862_01430 [endosymbiont of Acanthamoeba sp. UWC8]|uniref:hypothetical protein n=1 Tax=endosymbiont of Acanthamoeba sp. UWC8 TaxID=86106 RepID=UPI0004D1803A|nr:hypothetical protein [endosymbiont of Acanthamoeba sp. UWC8]AIF80849.1 hypothetical protein I862_01430 [endosymbiont of Acanthamoeba sp. UWC8]